MFWDTFDTNPVSQGSWMYWPPEWSKQKAVWLAWPHRRELWKDRTEQVEAVFVDLLLRLSRYVDVRCLAPDAKRKSLYSKRVKKEAQKLDGADPKRISFPVILTNDIWIRDYGPFWVKQLSDSGSGAKSRMQLLDFRFNGWGEKYRPYDDDDKAAAQIADYLKLPRVSKDYVLEGGAIETNGRTAFLSEDSIFDSARRLPFFPPQLLSELRRLLGIDHLVLLHGALPGDDTDGHVDMYMRFCNEHTLLLNTCSTKHPAKPMLTRNARILNNFCRNFSTFENTKKLVRLPMPELIEYKGRPLPRTYANFLITNGAVFVPVYDEPEDQKALKVLAKVFPDHVIEPVYAGDLILEGGAVHCMTMPEFAPPD